jgi:flagellar basal-body rod modification protein FlgD
MAEVSKIAETTDPYTQQTYKPQSTDKNTLSMENYFQLLSAELANQDMTNPMSTTDLMNEMSQMGMVQSMASMTEALKTVNTQTQQSYAASMVGRKIEYDGQGYTADDGTAVAEGTRKGVVESVNFGGDNPTFRIEGDPNDYELSAIKKVLKAEEEEDKDAKAKKNAAVTADTDTEGSSS